jgi:hypothetical protein
VTDTTLVTVEIPVTGTILVTALTTAGVTTAGVTTLVTEVTTVGTTEVVGGVAAVGAGAEAAADEATDHRPLTYAHGEKVLAALGQPKGMHTWLVRLT